MNNKEITKLIYHIRLIDRKIYKSIKNEGFLYTFNEHPEDFFEVSELLEKEDLLNLLYRIKVEISETKGGINVIN